MNQKWNLQDIRPSESRRKKASPAENKASDDAVVSNKKVKTKRNKKTTKKIWFFAGAVLFIIAIASSADVTVEPKSRLSTINTNLEAYLESNSDRLSFEIMTVKATAEREVTPTGEKQAEEKARGSIEVQNTTSQSQRLVATTRFATKEGLVYRTEEAITVPPASVNDDGETVPGTVQAEVVADEPGEKYNQPVNTKLTIPGYAEGGFENLFTSVTATVLEDFSGGFAGLRYEIEASELEQAQNTMRSELREALRTKLETDKPANFVLFENSIQYSYKTIPPSANEGEENKNTVQIVEEATLSVPLFPEAEFAEHIASLVVPGYEEEPLRIDNWNELNFAYADTSTTTNQLLNTNSVSFSLQGDAKMVWTFSKDDFKEDLAGEQRAALQFIIPEYPAIKKASAKIRPVWKRSYPEDIEKITVKEEIDWQN